MSYIQGCIKAQEIMADSVFASILLARPSSQVYSSPDLATTQKFRAEECQPFICVHIFARNCKAEEPALNVSSLPVIRVSPASRGSYHTFNGSLSLDLVSQVLIYQTLNLQIQTLIHLLSVASCPKTPSLIPLCKPSSLHIYVCRNILKFNEAFANSP